MASQTEGCLPGMVELGSLQERREPGLGCVTVLAGLPKQTQVNLRFTMAAYTFAGDIHKWIVSWAPVDPLLPLQAVTGRTAGQSVLSI